MKWICTTFFLLVGFYRCFAQTYISQNIDNTQTWTAKKSPYVITNDIFITPNSILNIEAGTKIYFSSEVRLYIEGQIICKGTNKKKVIFAALNNYRWQGISFKKAQSGVADANTDTAMNVFEHTVFKGRDWNPIHLLQIENRNIRLQNCQIIDCQTAIQTEKQARVIAKAISIQKCYRPLHIRVTSQLTFTDSEISDFTLLLIGGSVFMRSEERRVGKEC